MPQSVSNNPSGFWKIVLLIITAGAAVLLVSPVSANPAGDPGGKPVVTIIARGDGSYYLGEEAFFSGVNTDSDSTYLFMTGPNLPENGGNLASPSRNATGGDPGSFTVVKTKPDTTWDYHWYTSGLMLDAGSYTIYAASQPKAKDQLADIPYGTTSIIVKKPFIFTNISSFSVVQGQPFTITGTTEGNPPEVQIWIIGDTYVSTIKTPVNSDALFTFTADAVMSGKLPAGQNYLFVQHPMQNNQFDIAVSGDYVRDVNLNNGTNLFKVTGPGSLQGNDAAEALVAAFNENEAPRDYTVDTYTVIPFRVADTRGSTLQAPADTTVPVQQPTRQIPLQYAAPIGAGALILVGFVLWKRH